MLVEPQRAAQLAEAVHIGEDRAEDHRAQGALSRRRLACGLDLRPRCFQYLAVAHAGWANRLAGPAIETKAHLVLKGGIEQIEPALVHLVHQPDSAARRRTLPLCHPIGWAGGQAEAAVDAGVDDVWIRPVGTAESS